MMLPAMKIPRAIICVLALLTYDGRFAATAAQDVAGTWELKVETPQGTATPVMTLRQSAEKLSGTYRGRLGESSLEGTVKDTDIRFTVKLRFQDQEFVVHYAGKVEGASMTGTVQFQNGSTGKWTARRKPPTDAAKGPPFMKP